MAKRLQVILKDREYREIKRTARSRQLSIAEWVRQALAQASTMGTGRGIADPQRQGYAPPRAEASPVLTF